ncbi:hypothetical protein K2173_021552 [Erythroxylum novogranatense]|uniref:DUF4042 domain-containing protein n=1 Tax=Erythroxylum novogranatense TaxID=1862640 RepID=A0AAV8TQI2_9ROSI|nr:hypothetical protein K2173_021552 [Erythroxylum novogranatense]
MASTSAIRTWRTAFLTLRDETLTSSPKSESKTPSHLLHNLIFSHSDTLISAAPDLPPHEVTSDLLFLLELTANCRQRYEPVPLLSDYVQISRLMHDVCRRRRVSLHLNSSSWSLILHSFRNILQILVDNAGGDASATRPAVQCINTIRHLVDVYRQSGSVADNTELVNFLIHIVKCSHSQLIGTSCSSTSLGSGYSNLWEVLNVTFTMLGDAFTRDGSLFPSDTWQSTIEVLRKVMDVVGSNNCLVEDMIMSRFYFSLLNCLHVVLAVHKVPVSEHVSSFVAVLKMFFRYGLTSRMQHACSGHKDKQIPGMSPKLASEEPIMKDHAPYRPPHLRKKDSLVMKQSTSQNSNCCSDHESSVSEFLSSDSEYSDSDGSVRDHDSLKSSNVRVVAIVCIQDLCEADPKSFTSLWTMILPVSDVLQLRTFDATLMTCLLFDPSLKARIASASTLAVMLNGPSSVFLQVAEYRESTKLGSYVSLSNSLGQILVQLHTGILHLIQHETHSRLVTSLFKILTLLISSTPYPRMPGDLLPTVVKSLLSRTELQSLLKSDQTGFLVSTLNCLTAALSTSPPMPQIKDMLQEESSTGVVEAKKRSNLLSTLLQYSKQLNSPTICFETLQALRAAIHNYPTIAFTCWDQISAIVSKILDVAISDKHTWTCSEQMGENAVYMGEKIITAAIKVLDEYLRAVSEFRGTEGHLYDQSLDTPFTSNCIRPKRVSSAPSYEPGSDKDTDEESIPLRSGIEQWSKTIENYLPSVLWHTSGMVRTASITCFAGITSSVFFSLTKEKQDFVVSSLVNTAFHDEVPSVRSAACRAIGVISCFRQIVQSAEILDKFIRAVVINSHDPLVSVRITASWAMANICDSLRLFVHDFPVTMSAANKEVLIVLTECALHLTKDGDKVKSNAVRALGNLSRIFDFNSSSGMHDQPAGYLGLSVNKFKMLPASSNLQCGQGYSTKSYPQNSAQGPDLIEGIIQAFLSCVTTGNVKVQWNVCYALSNLFLNETLSLQDMDWAPSVFSVLLLLLRDSSNFKIKIQAASALAVPASVLAYGKSFPDVVQGVLHVLESRGSDKILSPSCFKYQFALEKQVTSTMLHVLSLASDADDQPLREFLLKKAQFLEEWFKVLCSSLEVGDTTTGQPGDYIDKKKELVSKALQSLIEVCENDNHDAIALKFEKLDKSIK